MRKSKVAYAVLLVAALMTPARAQKPLTVEGLLDDEVFEITARATARELVLDLAVKPEWHLYASGSPGGQPIAFEAVEGSAFAPAGSPRARANEKGEITGKTRVTVPLRRAREGRKLAIRFHYMTCDALHCRPPRSLTIAGAVAAPSAPALRILLVTAEGGERSKRITAFLKGRGFGVTTATYATVTQDACDQADVVVADSPPFRSGRNATRLARKFPKTASPLIAVGFLGTELLEAHKVTMACGYI
jgi:hypothetical protein